MQSVSRFLDQFVHNIGIERVGFHPLDGKHYLLRKICVRYRQFRICQHKANTLIYGQQNVKTNIIAWIFRNKKEKFFTELHL